MVLADIEIDLSAVGGVVKYAIVIGLFLISGYTLAWPSIRKLFNKKVPAVKRVLNPEFKRNGVDRSSDTPPPSGFATHLQIIEETAPNADTTVWWEYAKAEMTEAEVAIAEAKLARKPATEG